VATANGTISDLLRATPWRTHAFLSAFLFQREQFTAESAEHAEKNCEVMREVTSANSACSAVKRFRWGIRSHPVLFRGLPIGFREPLFFFFAGLLVLRHKILRLGRGYGNAEP
jgi:hypothetical protein